MNLVHILHNYYTFLRVREEITYIHQVFAINQGDCTPKCCGYNTENMEKENNSARVGYEPMTLGIPCQALAN